MSREPGILLASWSLEITDDQGHMQPFGPYTRDQESISGNVILGTRATGDYTIVMLGQTKGGASVRKEATVHLIHRDEPKTEAVRYSILFDFDKSLTVASYEKFLTEVVTPQIPNGGVVVIHGYTDTTGTDDYNAKLSQRRVEDVQEIIEAAASKSGKQGITFETFAFGRIQVTRILITRFLKEERTIARLSSTSFRTTRRVNDQPCQ